MFEFLKKLMTNNESVSAKETNFLHRILNTDIKEEPKSQEDETDSLFVISFSRNSNIFKYVFN